MSVVVRADDRCALPLLLAALFAAALADVERQLTERIEELIARRDTLHRLADGDRALLPDRAVALLERMRGVGFPADEVVATMEGRVLAKALVSEGFDDYLTHLEHTLEDTRLVALTKRAAEAAAWESDDPRIAELATAVADHYLANPALLKTVTGLQARTEAATRYTLIAHHGEEQTPAAARLAALSRPSSEPPASISPDQTPTDRAVLRSFGPDLSRVTVRKLRGRTLHAGKDAPGLARTGCRV